MKPELALALIMKKWRDWQNVVHYQLPSQQQAERLNFIRLYKLYKKMKEKENNKVLAHLRSSNNKRVTPSLGEVPIKKLNLDDKYPLVIANKKIPHDQYYNYIRIDVESYYELLKLVETKIKKKVLVKAPIPPHLRLQICLRYLASGNSMMMTAYEFEVASNTVSKIVTETCQVIWDILNDIVLPFPSKDIWLEKEQKFESQYSFPHCIGVIVAKQILFQSPFYIGNKSSKEKGSLILFGIVDTNCCFTMLNIGPETVVNNSIIFSQSQIGRNLQENIYDFPPLQTVSEKYSKMPYVLISSIDFPLTNKILHSYESNKTLDLSEQAFNQKINYVKKCSNNAFDILISQWKIFQKKFSTNANNTIKIIKAIVCLHNLLIKKEITKPVENRQYAVIIEKEHSDYLQGCIDILMYPEEPSNEAIRMRNTFKQKLCQVKTITLLNWP